MVSNSAKIKSTALAVIELRLSEGISKYVNQKKNPLRFLKFLNYVMEEFRIDLNTFFGLAMSNQYCPTVRM